MMKPSAKASAKVTVGGQTKPILPDRRDLAYVPITVSSGTVGSDLTDFPMIIDLRDMPASFWDNVRFDGGDIRCRDAIGNDLPTDVIYFNLDAQEGYVAVKQTLTAASDTTVYLHYGDYTLTRLAPTDPNARNAVWSDYEVVFFLGDSLEDRAGTVVSIVNSGESNNLEPTDLHTFTQDPHQGLTFDHEERVWYVTDTNALYKFSEDFTTLLASNLDPAGDTGIVGADHCSDLCVRGEYLYLSVNDFEASGSPVTIEHLCRFNKSDLTFDKSADIFSTLADVSGWGYDQSTGLLISSTWPDMGTIYFWNPESLEFDHTLTITNISPTDNRIQGIEYWQNAYWLSSDKFDEVFRCGLDGVLQSSGLFGDEVSSGNFEGICAYDNSMVVLRDPSVGNSSARQYAPLANDLAVGGGCLYRDIETDYREVGGLSSFTTWTVGVSFRMNTNKQQALLTYRDASSGTTNDRMTVAVDDGDKMAVWDNLNSWLYCTPNEDPLLTWHRSNVVYVGTTERRLYYDGAQCGVDTTITARDSQFDMIGIGTDDESRAEAADSDIAFVYLRGEDLGSDWIAAEYLNINNSTGFYTVGAEFRFMTIINPDAETGDGTGWEIMNGEINGRTSSPTPIQGTYSFNAEFFPFGQFFQDLTLTDYATESELDGGQFTAHYFGWQYSDGSDTGYLWYEWRDANKTIIGSRETSGLTAPTAWTFKEISSVAPANARYLRIGWYSDRNAGITNDVCFDALFAGYTIS